MNICHLPTVLTKCIQWSIYSIWQVIGQCIVTSGPFNTSSYECFSLYEFVELVLIYMYNELVVLTNLCEMRSSCILEGCYRIGLCVVTRYTYPWMSLCVCVCSSLCVCLNANVCLCVWLCVLKHHNTIVRYNPDSYCWEGREMTIHQFIFVFCFYIYNHIFKPSSQFTNWVYKAYSSCMIQVQSKYTNLLIVVFFISRPRRD